jgi:DMSO/TMAO reductase YedYZ molybdopterin-dependent catalytic subunit
VGCAVDPAIVRGSTHVPTPDAPLTPTSRFYVNSNFGLPDVPRTRAWRLHLGGLVDRERALSLDELRSLPALTREITLECIGNDPGGNLISSAAFSGPSLRSVLERAGVSSRARGIYVEGLDGYPSFVPVAAAEDDRALVVLDMNGAPLTPDHGAPARVLFPDRFGMFSIKWLDRITLTREWHQFGALRGVATFVDGKKRVRSRIDEPNDGRTVVVGEETIVSGLAVTAGTGIERVEARVQPDGDWSAAEILFNTLTDERSPYLWSLWRFAFTPRAAGRVVLSVRAFDAEGGAQDDDPDFPYDASAIHSVRLLVRE